MRVTRLDHLVLTVKDIEASVAFYQSVLGMKKVIFGNGRVALIFGDQKINLHQAGAEFEPKAALATPGSADLCFVVSHNIEAVITHLNALQIDIIEGPVLRTGATGRINSVYIRDPDLNLLELSEYLPACTR
ncbi:VOC family protein [Shewanella putrefaciens]|jgi:catechol 2,3-dioxygenase-like lactoylglutathione lyase family enzyme|uniref:Glyoxalase/bleomycin resistance protein/dioxygenase n=2 Tax=Shewanella putrefaciens TaxID=24 RepID=E6XS11_SHEP2|nr:MULTISPECIES: VOC family protein [Shewanella]CAD6366143.1 Virulence protein [Shewanella hafniensis]ABM25483.1 Glyoxalase/bleomycin resistance protein/dioxygenase [Shewanella sp. W3-18-1]AVV82950.1 virulence protein glyoxalase/bleomycin resistance protein/dioxygenase [Shewanella putrefaciens]MCA1895911.1 VOC family protein [Shewanella putrefaciens]MCK7635813.1 VOC family protein [Shewanella sp. JNE17]